MSGTILKIVALMQSYALTFLVGITYFMFFGFINLCKLRRF